MTRTRKRLLIVACILAGLVLAFVVALAIIGRDESPPDDSLLILHRLDIPEDENGFTFILQAQEALYWPGTKAWKEAALHPLPTEDTEGNTVYDSPQTMAADTVKEQAEAMVDGKAWHPDLATEIIERNGKTLDLFRKAMACRQFQEPEVTGIGDRLPWVFDHLAMMRMLVVWSRALARQGKTTEALDRAVEVVQFGHAIELSKGPFITYLVGLVIKQEGLAVVREHLNGNGFSPDPLKAVADRLARHADGSQGMADAMRVEYTLNWKTAKGMVEGAAAEARKPLSGLGIVWKPNQTKRWFVEALRPGVEQAGKPLCEIHWSIDRPCAEWGLARRILSGNITGQMAYMTLMPAVASIATRECQERTDVAMTQTLIALKAFNVKYGRLPQSLDELVPEFLPAVPLDDFDGKPIRYSPEKKVVYSVGKDFKEDGGMTCQEARAWWNQNERSPEDGPLPDDEEPNVWDLPDPSFPIEF